MPRNFFRFSRATRVTSKQKLRKENLLPLESLFFPQRCSHQTRFSFDAGAFEPQTKKFPLRNDWTRSFGFYGWKALWNENLCSREQRWTVNQVISSDHASSYFCCSSQWICLRLRDLWILQLQSWDECLAEHLFSVCVCYSLAAKNENGFSLAPQRRIRKLK